MVDDIKKSSEILGVKFFPKKPHSEILVCDLLDNIGVYILLRRQTSVYKHFSSAGSMYKYFSGAGEVFLNTSRASPAKCSYTSPASQKHFYIWVYLSEASPALEKPGEYLKHLSGAGDVFIHFSGAGEVLIYTYLAPEMYLYTPIL